MRHPRTRTLLPVLLALAAGLVATSPLASPPAFRVIVNPANASNALDRKFITEIFLKRSTRWPTGETIRPADQGTDSPVRRRFSEEVMNRSVAAVKSYWQQMIFSGRAIPPPELDTDEEVLRYVAKYPGAIGYVSGASDVTGVKVLGLK